MGISSPSKHQVTTFAYDSRNRLLSTTDALGKVETYTYDGNDNLVQRPTPKGDDRGGPGWLDSLGRSFSGTWRVAAYVAVSRVVK